jgi:hypothetical protein
MEFNRQLWWNYVAIPSERKLNWLFVIINDKRESNVISNKIFGKLAMIEDLVEIDGKSGNRHYKILVFKSKKTLETNELSSIYRGMKKRDVRLYLRARKGIEGLETYVQRKLDTL